MLSNFSSKQEDKSRFVLGRKMCKYIQGVQHNGLIYIYCEMITTIGSTNIHLLLQTQYVEEKGEKNKGKIFSLWWGLRFTNNNFSVCYPAVLTIVICWTLHSKIHFFLITGSLYLLTTITHLSHLLPCASRNQQSVLSVSLGFVCFIRFHI